MAVEREHGEGRDKRESRYKAVDVTGSQHSRHMPRNRQIALDSMDAIRAFMLAHGRRSVCVAKRTIAVDERKLPPVAAVVETDCAWGVQQARPVRGEQFG